MKTKQTIILRVLIALAVSFGFVLVYQPGSKSNQTNLSAPGNLRQIGLAFRKGRNDVQSLNLTPGFDAFAKPSGPEPGNR